MYVVSRTLIALPKSVGLKLDQELMPPTSSTRGEGSRKVQPQDADEWAVFATTATLIEIPNRDLGQFFLTSIVVDMEEL